jgi:hypothetical protein
MGIIEWYFKHRGVLEGWGYYYEHGVNTRNMGILGT